MPYEDHARRVIHVKVIYLMGSARSGSTFLNTILGGHPSAFAAGELCNVIKSMDVRREYCSCGVLSEACSFWTQVRQEWKNTVGRGLVDEFSDLLSCFEQPRRFEWIRSYSRRWRHGHDRSAWRRYSTLTSALFTAIQKVSGVDIVVDSSKSPVRALALSEIGDLELHVIHLVRDVRGVVYSLNKAWEPDPKAGIVAPLAAMRPSVVARRWAETNFSSNRVRHRLGERTMLVRYEDLVGAPEATLERIGGFTGLNLSDVATKVRHGEQFQPGHQIAGNRLRMKSTIRLNPDVRWQHELSSLKKYWIWALAGGLAGLYGYHP